MLGSCHVSTPANCQLPLSAGRIYNSASGIMPTSCRLSLSRGRFYNASSCTTPAIGFLYQQWVCNNRKWIPRPILKITVGNNGFMKRIHPKLGCIFSHTVATIWRRIIFIGWEDDSARYPKGTVSNFCKVGIPQRTEYNNNNEPLEDVSVTGTVLLLHEWRRSTV